MTPCVYSIIIQSPKPMWDQVTCRSRAHYLVTELYSFSVAPSHKCTQFNVFSCITQLRRRSVAFFRATGVTKPLLLFTIQQPVLKAEPSLPALPLPTDGTARGGLRDSRGGEVWACAQQRSWFATPLSAADHDSVSAINFNTRLLQF